MVSWVKSIAEYLRNLKFAEIMLKQNLFNKKWAYICLAY